MTDSILQIADIDNKLADFFFLYTSRKIFCSMIKEAELKLLPR